MDARPGGSWRYLQRNADGAEFAFRGVYHDVLAPERLISTFEFELAIDRNLIGGHGVSYRSLSYLDRPLNLA